MKVRLLFICYICVIFAACMELPEPELLDGKAPVGAAHTNSNDELKDGKLNITIFDVGEGDATLVVAPSGKAALIDTGLAGNGTKTIKPYIDEHKDIALLHLFISHNDNDHNGAVSEIDMSPEATHPGDIVELDSDVSITVLAVNCTFIDDIRIPCADGDDNAHSSALLIEYGSFRYLTAGDLPGGGGNPPYDTIDMETHLGELVGDIDVLHVGHHGSNTSTNDNLLKMTTPEAAVISAGNNNPFWHPHQSTIERLINSGIEVYQTERGWLKDEFTDKVHIANGNITIESDGDGYVIK